MQKVIGLWLLLWMLLGVASASAQPVCNPAFPATITCESQAVSPTLTDVVAAIQAIGPDRPNESVKLSIGQILGLPGSTQYLPFSGGTLTGKLVTPAPTASLAGLNLPPGVSPTAPANGDVWLTAAGGLFININGVPTSILGGGSGGGVNSGAINSLAYYGSTGSTVSPLAAVAGSVLQTSALNVPSFSKTLPTGITVPLAILQPATYATPAALPTVSVSNAGQQAFVTNCQNGTETTGTATGCLYVVNNAGAWIANPAVPPQTMTIGGQVVAVAGGVTTNQGTGAKLATFNGTGTSGDCVSIAASGALQDAGSACGGGGGGSGTVTAGTLNQLAFYASSGTTVAGLASVNNSVMVTSGSGVPSFASTLPASLTIPGPTISNPVLTGAGSYVGLTGSGKLSTAASTTTQAGINLAPGVAPTAPANGDSWSTSAGFFIRYNGATYPIGSGNGTITGITTPGPITGGASSGTVTLGCATCLTSSTGGLLTIAAPLSLTGSALSLGLQTKPFIFNADQYTTVAAATYSIYLSYPYGSGSVVSVKASTGGSSSPAFTIGVQINGVNVASCASLTVTPSTPVAATCGANAIATGNPVTLILSAVAGLPSSATIQVNTNVSAI